MRPHGLLQRSGPPIEIVTGGGGALLFSMRRIADLVGYCALYEFEDLLVRLTDADVLQPTSLQSLDRLRSVYHAAHRLTGSAAIADAVTRPRRAHRPARHYDLFLAVFNHPGELFALKALKGWRTACDRAACYICEAWTSELPVHLLALLRDFDHVFLGVRGAVPAVQEITGVPCTYLPMAVDALAFCPYPDRPVRGIDVCGIGRRSAVTHEALLQLARRSGMFYFYDTLQLAPGSGQAGATTFRVTSAAEHRTLLANIVKRSRYFIANRAYADRPALTNGADEIAARFYEGTAAGAVVVGEPPDTDEFRSQFGWPDSVISVPFHAPAIGEVIAELDRDPARLENVRRNNVVHALLRHDWASRIRTLLQRLELPLPPSLIDREARLRALAEVVGALDRSPDETLSSAAKGPPRGAGDPPQPGAAGTTR